MHAGYRWFAPTLTAQSKIALIVGANSAIARTIARRLSVQGYALLLMARDEPRLEVLSCELQRDGATVLIDSLSREFMGGAEIDYVDDLIGQSFQIRNPNAVASCGCGTSFAVA